MMLPVLGLVGFEGASTFESSFGIEGQRLLLLAAVEVVAVGRADVKPRMARAMAEVEMRMAGEVIGRGDVKRFLVDASNKAQS